MAGAGKPHFHNDMGVDKILVGSTQFMCIGAKPPFDHPHVFLNMGTASEIVCPYCSTLYLLDHNLAEGAATPAGAVWQSQAA